jgi:hypothetical protein
MLEVMELTFVGEDLNFSKYFRLKINKKERELHSWNTCTTTCSNGIRKVSKRTTENKRLEEGLIRLCTAKETLSFIKSNEKINGGGGGYS